MNKVFLLASGIFLLSACKPDDKPSNSVPVISLNGSNDQTVSLQGSYTEQGATANDVEDGNISSKIAISGTVNTAYADTYHVYYDVTDADGNKAAQMTRYVKVRNDAYTMEGIYDVASSWVGSLGGAPILSNRVVQLAGSKTVNNKLDLLDMSGNNLSAWYMSLGSATMINLHEKSTGNTLNSSVISSPIAFRFVYQTMGSGFSMGTVTDDYTKQ